MGAARTRCNMPGSPRRSRRQGYIVAGLYHYRANTYDQTIAYLSNKIWQRPRDISLGTSTFC